MEIVQVFCHKPNMQQGRIAQSKDGNGEGAQSHGRSGTNDYVIVVVKIKSDELKKFYGNGKYLL
jgi:hypothetical protein